MPCGVWCTSGTSKQPYFLHKNIIKIYLPHPCGQLLLTIWLALSLSFWAGDWSNCGLDLILEAIDFTKGVAACVVLRANRTRLLLLEEKLPPAVWFTKQVLIISMSHGFGVHHRKYTDIGSAQAMSSAAEFTLSAMCIRSYERSQNWEVNCLPLTWSELKRIDKNWRSEKLLWKPGQNGHLPIKRFKISQLIHSANMLWHLHSWLEPYCCKVRIEKVEAIQKYVVTTWRCSIATTASHSTVPNAKKEQIPACEDSSA